MKYFRDSKSFPGVKEHYDINYYAINKNYKNVTVTYIKTYITDSGFVEKKEFSDSIMNLPSTMIVDSNWNENSNPPKPSNFKIDDPFTWGTLSWEDIPMIEDTSKNYYDMIANGVNDGKNVEKLIMEILIKRGSLPSDESWKFDV